MNVLILTPDRVGSTLLQRLITVYMTAHVYDRPVINLHELTNGLVKYYNPTFKQEVLGKPIDDKPWGYYQTLPEITSLLSSVDHYKTSRLAHYHIKRRQDTIADQVPFYEYLNDNFFIISAQRNNLLEHGLSWCIQAESKKLNVYSHKEKVEAFSNIYQNRITVDTTALIKYLDQYVDYLRWVDNHFHVSSYFRYEDDLPRIEDYILGLNIFNGQSKQTWKDMFEIEFKDWNRCHYLISDLSGISGQLAAPETLKLGYTELHSVEQKAIPKSLSLTDQTFLDANSKKYVKTYAAIDQMVNDRVLVTPVPIKLQTMLEKKLLIKNFDQCVDAYNEWTVRTGHGQYYTPEDLAQHAYNEIVKWHDVPKLT